MENKLNLGRMEGVNLTCLGCCIHAPISITQRSIIEYLASFRSKLHLV
jgi:NADH:ubiquinone oxidoreductase subunit E